MSGSLSHTTGTITVTVQDFTITASPTSIVINAGASGTATITVAPVNGFTGTVALTASASAGLTATLSPTSITGGSGTSTLTVTSAASGNYTVTVTGTSGTLSHTTQTIFVRVVDFQIFASPSTVNTTPGVAGSSTITVSPLNGFTGTVALSTSVSPAGLTCTLSPTSVTGGSGTSTLSCSGTAGTYTVVVTGTSGSLSHTANVTVNVQDFTITNSGTITVTQGSCNTGTITISSQGGFSGTVTLTAAPSNSTLTATLTPTSVVMSGSSVLKVCAASNTSTGSYSVTVTGTSGSLSHSTTVPVTVTVAQQGCPHDTNPNTCVPPSFSQMNWVHRLSISKTGGVQTWKFGVLNNNNDTIYVQVQITGTDGSGVNGFTIASPVLTLNAGKNLVGQTLSVVIPASDIGDTFQWSAVILWGTSPTNLSNTSTLNQGVPTSGSFTVLA
jgi:hypothetical protein